MRYFSITIITFILIITSVNSQNYRILRHFTGNGIDASHPQGALLFVDSTFYATSHWGGTYDKGCVYRINPDGTGFRLLYSFSDWKTGAYPLQPLLYTDTLLYGITQGNTFFSIDKNGKNFTTIDIENSDSAHIYGSILKFEDYIYSTESYSGINVSTRGALIKYKLDGTGFYVLKAFFRDSSDGAYPRGPYFAYGNRLYGLVEGSGINPWNMLYSINKDGTDYSILHKFSGGKNNGAEIVNKLILWENTIYGIANRGGEKDSGVVFSINPDGSNFKILHHFSGDSADGTQSWSKLTPYGKYLFGTTKRGGKYRKGAIFKMSKDGSDYKILHYFGNMQNDGFSPNGDMTLEGNSLYGTTWRGGRNDLGTIFKITELDFWDSCGTESFNYPFFHTSDGLKLNGSAVASDSAVNLVKSEPNLAGSVFCKYPVTVANGFKCTFCFRFSEGWNSFIDGSAPGADGIVFLLQAVNNSVVGDNGGGLGYKGIPNSLAVEFDSYKNTDIKDSDGNHIAVFSNGLEPNTCIHKSKGELGCASVSPEFRADSSLYFAKIEYSHLTNKLKIWFDMGDEFEKPVLEIDSLDLSSLMNLLDGDKAYIGFTSATGTSHQKTDLLNWSFCPRISEWPNEVGEYSENIRIIIKPNPARDYIEINVGTGRDLSLPGSTVYVYNVLGECVIVGAGSEPALTKPTHTKIDISNLPPGVYFIRCVDRYAKFVKQE